MQLKEKLLKIQTELKAPKNLHNSFGNYNYRNAESIYESVKPLLTTTKTILLMQDEIVQIGDRFYVKATATISDTETEEKISTSAFAREPIDKKGQDQSQITGSTSSFARKYALNGLFILDDTKDEDSDELRNEKNNKVAKMQEVKPRQDVSVDYVTQAQLEIISKSSEKLDKETKIKLMKEFKVNKIAELTKANADKFIERINDINKAQEVKNG